MKEIITESLSIWLNGVITLKNHDVLETTIPRGYPWRKSPRTVLSGLMAVRYRRGTEN